VFGLSVRSLVGATKQRQQDVSGLKFGYLRSKRSEYEDSKDLGRTLARSLRWFPKIK
jgi:hypothetical protein